MYAGRKRRKPVQRTAKPPPPEGVKSNPSKRHRDRLNSELERLAGLLPFPEEVVSTLDKLSILRLSVSYLRAKSFFHIALKSHCGKGGAERSGDRDKERTLGRADGILPEGELLLQALNGFVLVVTSEGEIFYSSHTIQDYLGFHQTDVLHQSVFELIHTEDQPEFRRNLHWALSPPPAPKSAPSPEGDAGVGSSLPAYEPGQLPPENSAFLERSFVCRFRCLLDSSSGFLPLNLQGRLKFLHGQKQRSEDRCLLPPQLALFVISTPLQPPSILEIRTKNMIFRTKHTLDFTPLACDAKGKIVLGYTEAELRMRGTGYQFIHAADMLYCAENHVRMMKTGESGLTVFRLLTKNNCWKWMQANARLVYKNGKPDYIIATQRPLAEEEGGEHLRKRSTHLPFTFAMGEALLYQSACPCPGFPEPFPSKGKPRKPKKHSPGKGGWPQKDSVDPSSLLGAMMRQNEAVYASHPASTPKHAVSHPLSPHQGDSGFSGSGEDSWSGVANPLASGETGPKPALADGRPGDPLLSTLSSLSSSSDEACSTNELFAALEGLGLTAEDLELLLLDERMVRVDLDLDHVPSLNDLLTNNEILSYVHGSLASRCEGGPTGEQQTCPLSGPAPNPSPDLGACPSQTPEERYPCSPQPPPPLISHLPQQMQQRLASQSPQGSQPWEPPLSCGRSQLPPPLTKQADEEKQPPGLQWRPPAGAAEVGPSPIGQAPLGNRPQGPQWVRPPVSSHLHQPLAPPYRQQQPAPSLESSPYAVPGAMGPFLQQSQPCLPSRPAPAHTEPPSQLMLKPNQRLLVNRPDGHGSAGRPGPGNNPWQGCWPANQPARGLPAQPRVCGVERGRLCLPQLYPAPAPNPGGAALPFYLDGLPSTGTGASGACREEMTPCPRFVPPSSYHPKPPSPVPSASQYPASEHWGAAHGQQEGSMHSYGTHAAFLGQENIRKPESDCVLTSANVGYPGDCLLPNGNPAPSDELHSCMATLLNHSDPASGGFYL